MQRGYPGHIRGRVEEEPSHSMKGTIVEFPTPIFELSEDLLLGNNKIVYVAYSIGVLPLIDKLRLFIALPSRVHSQVKLSMS